MVWHLLIKTSNTTPSQAAIHSDTNPAQRSLILVVSTRAGKSYVVADGPEVVFSSWYVLWNLHLRLAMMKKRLVEHHKRNSQSTAVPVLSVFEM